MNLTNLHQAKHAVLLSVDFLPRFNPEKELAMGSGFIASCFDEDEPFDVYLLIKGRPTDPLDRLMIVDHFILRTFHYVLYLNAVWYIAQEPGSSVRRNLDMAEWTKCVVNFYPGCATFTFHWKDHSESIDPIFYDRTFLMVPHTRKEG